MKLLIFTLAVVLIGYLIVWGWNVTKFLSCDFQAPYKCEVVHGIGVVIPPVSIITVWIEAE